MLLGITILILILYLLGSLYDSKTLLGVSFTMMYLILLCFGLVLGVYYPFNEPITYTNGHDDTIVLMLYWCMFYCIYHRYYSLHNNTNAHDNAMSWMRLVICIFMCQIIITQISVKFWQLTPHDTFKIWGGFVILHVIVWFKMLRLD